MRVRFSKVRRLDVIIDESHGRFEDTAWLDRVSPFVDEDSVVHVQLEYIIPDSDVWATLKRWLEYGVDVRIEPLNKLTAVTLSVQGFPPRVYEQGP